MRSFKIASLGFLLFLFFFDSKVQACTSFCMDTPQGPIFASNLDLFIPGDGLVFINQRGVVKEGPDVSTDGARAKWISKYGSVTFNLAGREFAFSGMNEAGLVIGTMELMASKFPEPDIRPPLSIGTWAQYILDTCSSIKEVIKVDAIVRIQDQASPVHFLISDAFGNSVAVEWFDGKFVYHLGDNLPVKAMSNMPYSRALKAYESGGARWWWSNPGRSAERFAGAAWRCENYDVDRDTSAVNYAFETLTHIVAASHTKWSIVYDINKREVWYGSAASLTLKNLSLNNFDLSCDAPLLMIDINAQVEGNLEQVFKPYDKNINLIIFRNFCESYGIKVTHKASSDLMKFYDNFICAD